MKYIKKEYNDRIEYRNEQGELHRTDGPAIEWNSGSKEWYINGERHREDGPAIEYLTSDREWWINGKEYSEENWKQKVTELKLKRILDL